MDVKKRLCTYKKEGGRNYAHNKIIRHFDKKQVCTLAVQHNYDKRFVSSDLRIAFR